MLNRYLIVVPSILPEFDNDIPPWEPPFLELITSRHNNRLKACLIPGKANLLSVTLFPAYDPCSTDLHQVMACGEILRKTTNRNVPCALVRLFKQQIRKTDVERQQETSLVDRVVDLDDNELRHAFARQQANIKSWSVTAVPFLDLRLVLSPNSDTSTTQEFITRLSIDIIAWQSLAVYICCDGNLPRESQRLVAESLHLDVRGASFTQALAFGRAVSAPRPWKTRHIGT